MRPTLAATAVALGCSANPPAEPGEAVWTRTQQRTQGAQDRALDVELSSEGLVVVGLEARDDEESDGFVRAHDRSGEPDWAVTFDRGLGTDELASGVAIDAIGGIVVAGAAFDDARDWDIWVARYDADGTLVAEDYAGDQGEDQGVGVAVSPDGVAVVAGYIAVGATTDAWVRAYDRQGAALWTDTYDGPAAGVDVATDAGYDATTQSFVIVGYETTAAGDTDVWLRRYDAGGTATWTEVVNGPAGADRGQGVAVDMRGRVHAVGVVAFPGRTVDAWLGRFAAQGGLVWTREHDGPEGLGDGAADLAIDAVGNIVVGGYEFGAEGAWDAWVRKYDAHGMELWTHVYAGEAGGDDLVAGVAVDEDGDVYVAGSTTTADGRATWLRRIRG